ncbi:MAG: metallophosphoesterase [Symploca sp. SIO1C2]|nr:metallophosphoesterase [Symploca sp. SIO1C2]
MSNTQDIFFAAVGDVHGNMHSMVRDLKAWEKKHNHQLAFVLQVGDFEPQRDEADLVTTPGPKKYRKLGDFPDFYTGKAVFPWSIWFIAGNHEPYGFLEQMPQGGEVAHNCYYLGRVGSVTLSGLKIVGVSGIYEPKQFYQQRPDVSLISKSSNKKYVGFTETEILEAIAFSSADILLLHDWPSGIISSTEAQRFGWSNEVGNEYARLLVESLQPKLVLCGHMHQSYRTQLSLPKAVTDICCLANVKQGMPQVRDAIAIFHLSSAGKLVELKIDAGTRGRGDAEKERFSS